MAEEYTIELVERWTFLNAQGNPTDGYRVTFHIPDLDIVDHVILAEANYSKENVQRAIEEKIKTHTDVLTI